MTTPVSRTDVTSPGYSGGGPLGEGLVPSSHRGVRPEFSSSRAHPERSARLVCDLTPSRYLKACLLLIAVQSLLLLLASRLPWAVVALLAPAIVAFSLFEWRLLSRSVGRLSTSEKRWYWQVKGGAKREFNFCGELTLWRWLIVINGRDLEGRSLRLVVAKDATGAEAWRRLQVALRFSRSA